MTRVYQALADPTRRHILKLLRDRDMTAGELAENFDLAKPTLSKHFAVLREAPHPWRQDGTSTTYSLNVSVLEVALISLLLSFKLNPGGGKHE